MRYEFEVDCYGCTNTGKKRKVNEDQYLIAELQRVAEVKGTSLPPENLGRMVGVARGLLLMVADGVGGDAGGEEARSVALGTVLEYITGSMESFYRCDGDLLDELARSVHASHREVLARAEEHPEHGSMKTTLTEVFVLWPHAHIVHIGDSRCYLVHGQQIQQLTKDQTLAQDLADKGTLEPDQAAGSRWEHVLTQAIGSAVQHIEPALSRIELMHGDTLLLCTDGLTRHLSDAAIREMINSASPARHVCEALMEEALDAGGEDNITVVCSRFQTINHG
jgi:protein phosphatase